MPSHGAGALASTAGTEATGSRGPGQATDGTELGGTLAERRSQHRGIVRGDLPHHPGGSLMIACSLPRRRKTGT
jgi:hypothetical protein